MEPLDATVHLTNRNRPAALPVQDSREAHGVLPPDLDPERAIRSGREIEAIAGANLKCVSHGFGERDLAL